MIDVEDVHVFLSVVQTLSFTEAAHHLHVSQPTVSKRVHDLETDLGTQLFDRSNNHLRLTEAGRTVLPWARKFLRQSHFLEEIARSLDQDVVGPLSIVCTTAAGKYILPQLAANFRQRYPYVDVNIMRCGQGDLVDHLFDHDAHLGVVSHEFRTLGTESQEFFEDRITLIVPPDHPWAKCGAIDAAELLEERLIMREPTSGTRRVVLEALAQYDISLEDLNVFLVVGSSEGIVSTVAAGYGVAFVSALAAECPLARGSVVGVKLSGMELRRKIYMVRLSLDDPSRPQEVFWSFVHDPANEALLRSPFRVGSVTCCPEASGTTVEG
jgi:DNA-binding transcriptional LysR family regulator